MNAVEIAAVLIEVIEPVTASLDDHDARLDALEARIIPEAAE